MQPLLLVLITLGVISLVTLFWLGVNAARKHKAWGMLVLLFAPMSALIYGIRHWQDARVPFIAYSISLVSAVALAAYLLHASGTWQVMHASLHMHQAVLSKDLSGRDALVFTPVSMATFTRVSNYEREQRRLQLMQDFIDSYEEAFTDRDREEIYRTMSRLMRGSAVTEEQKQRLQALQERLASRPEPEAAASEPADESQAGSDIHVKAPHRRPAEPRYRLEFLPISSREARDYIGKMFMVTRKDGKEKKYKLIGTSPGGLRFERRIPGGTYSFEYKHRDIEQLRILAQVAY